MRLPIFLNRSLNILLFWSLACMVVDQTYAGIGRFGGKKLLHQKRRGLRNLGRSACKRYERRVDIVRVNVFNGALLKQNCNFPARLSVSLSLSPRFR